MVGALAALAAVPLVPAEAAPAKPNGAKAAGAGDQPYASAWHPNTLLSWTPDGDPDSRFNRSRVPLRPRTVDAGLKANANARAGEGRVASLAAFAPTSKNPSQGSQTADYYAFGYWQYLDTLVFWGGSASEGLILAPNPTVIDAAHRNGVKVYGTVFFPPNTYGGQISWVRDFLQKSGSTFPVADKLVDVAKHYGFDGWFINQETEGGTTTDATRMRELIKYARGKGSVDFMWYDSMTEDGSIRWQRELNAKNDAFLEDGGRVSDSMFLDFDSDAAQLDASRTYARSIGRSEYELFAGENVGYNCEEEVPDWEFYFPAGKPHVTSLGFYRPECTWSFAKGNRDQFYASDSTFWVGQNGDPSNTTTTKKWKGLAQYIAEATPITAKPFVTSFNTGHGDAYYSAGKRVATGGWNNLSLQDVPPTYRWIVQSSGSKLKPAMDFSDAYEGGSSLRLSGKLDATNTVRLYQTRLPVTSDTRLSVAVKTQAAGATHLKAAVAFTDAPTTFVELDLGSTSGTGWENKTLDLSQYAGKTIAQVGLRASAPSAIPSYSVNVGKLAVYDGQIDAPGAASGATVLGATDVSSSRKSLRLSWTAPSGPVHHYDILRVNPDGTRTYLGGTPNDAYFVPQLDRVGDETTTTLEVVAVSPEGGRASAATTTVSWTGASEPDAQSNLALKKSATGSTACNSAEEPEKAVNGSVSGGNSDKWCSLASSQWLEVDLGSARSLTKFVVKHAGAGGESTSWNTRDFTIQVRSSASADWQTVATVTGNTASETSHPVTADARYVRLAITKPTQTTDPAARIYELEAWGR
ncbi:endo-beta-N-acetylglucosaminidase [Streptomyces sp. KR80]|uniref:endo-beta-N-acetylglucosaminidase n=1 Tax=Streptomyces sp. KR80 TaxID=3457426 RepID=UPI003FD639FA